MKKRLLIVSVLTSSLYAQDNPALGAFQVYFKTPFGTNVRSLDEGFDNKVVEGKPFSATEERRTVQILGNGTRIETSQSNRLYRDSQGRTRVEDMNGKIAIFDAVAGFRAELDPATKIARTSNANLPLQYLGVAVAALQGAQGQLNAARGPSGEVTENLKPQTINGVMAQGTKVTTTIPRGQIGNDRDIVVTTERWVSNDLQMLVKSVNSDPRFGDTTYELMRIVQGPQDPGLFQIPSDYKETGPNGRGGGRGPGPAGTAPLPGARGGGRSGPPTN